MHRVDDKRGRRTGETALIPSQSNSLIESFIMTEEWLIKTVLKEDEKQGYSAESYATLTRLQLKKDLQSSRREADACDENRLS